MCVSGVCGVCGVCGECVGVLTRPCGPAHQGSWQLLSMPLSSHSISTVGPGWDDYPSTHTHTHDTM